MRHTLRHRIGSWFRCLPDALFEFRERLTRRRTRPAARAALGIVPLEDRLVPAITGVGVNLNGITLNGWENVYVPVTFCAFSVSPPVLPTDPDWSLIYMNPARYTAEIKWGDGVVEQGIVVGPDASQNFFVIPPGELPPGSPPRHSYADPGTYVATVKVTGPMNEVTGASDPTVIYEAQAIGFLPDHSSSEGYPAATEPEYFVSESAPYAEVPIHIRAVHVAQALPERPITIHYSTMSGSATAGQDFVSTSGTLTFQPGETDKTILIPLIWDQAGETTDEDFTVTLSSPSDATFTLVNPNVNPSGPIHTSVTTAKVTITQPSGWDGGGGSGTYPAGGVPKLPDMAPSYGGSNDLIDSAPGADNGAACCDQPLGFSEGPVRYADGVIHLTATDLGAGGFGLGWGQTRGWTNGAGYAADGTNGNGVVVSQLPRLVHIQDTSTIGLISNGTTVRLFDLVGNNYVARHGAKERLQYVRQLDRFELSDTAGNRIRFAGFSAAASQARSRGQFLGMTDAAGNDIAVTAVTGDGKVSKVQRTFGSLIESYEYAYLGSGTNAGKVERLTLNRSTDGGTSWAVIRLAEYAYYGTGESFGNAGDLKTATVRASVGGAVLDQRYYRYYTSNTAPGYTGGLQFVFGPESFARLDAALADPFTASKDDVKAYADLYFEYDAQRRVTLEKVQGAGASATGGGIGTYTLAYTTSGFAAGRNNWKTKTVETLPDNNQNIVYTNAYGQVLLKVFRDGTSGQEWATYHRYDEQGREVLTAAPSAVASYSESQPDLVGESSGTLQAGTVVTLNDSTYHWQFSGGLTAGMDQAGNTVAVWTSYDSDGTDFNIYARRFDAKGTQVGTVLPVNTTRANTQNLPQVAVDAAGNFVVVWQGYDADGSYGIFARRYYADGTARDTLEFPVGQSTGNQVNPQVAMSPGGDFVVVWNSNHIDGGFNYRAYGRVYYANGSPPTGAFDLNTGVNVYALNPAVAMDAAGNFVVTYALNTSPEDLDSYGVLAQRFNRAGQRVGERFLVNQSTTGAQAGGAVGLAPDGSMVFVWGGPEVYARRFSADGKPLGDEIPVNETTSGDQSDLRVAVDRDGRFVVSWRSFAAGSTTNWDVYVRRFKSDGGYDGGEVRVTPTTVTASHWWSTAGVASNGAGDFLVHWTSYDASPGGGEYDVSARRYSRDATGLRSDAGFMTTYQYYAGTTATADAAGGADGYLRSTSIQRGEAGVPVPQSSTEYIAHTDGPSSTTVFFVAAQTAYRNNDGTGAQTTTYAYDDWDGLQPGRVRVTLPTVSAGQNGPGAPAVTETVYDRYGRPVWVKDADGFLHYTAYDTATGAVVRSIVDVDTTQTDDFSDEFLPDDWSTLAGGVSGPAIRLDFGTATSPVAAGYTRVTGDDTYTTALGYGWTAAVYSHDRGGASDRDRDFAYGADGTFLVDVPNGTYRVTVTIGDSLVTPGYFGHDDIGVFLEGRLADKVTAPPGAFLTLTYVAVVTDGQLSLRLQDQGGSDPNFVLNALEITSGAGLHLMTEVAVDAQGRPLLVTDPAERQTQTTYYDDAQMVVAWAVGASAPKSVFREDRTRGYTETYLVPAGTSFTLSPTTGVWLPSAQPLSLSRTVLNAAGQVVGTDEYYNLSGVTYSEETDQLGAAWSSVTPDTAANYYHTEYGYDGRGRQDRVVSATGTITRVVYDSRGRAVSTWVGTDDMPTSGEWSQTNTAGTNLVRVSANAYDGGGIGDGNLTQTTAYPGGGVERETGYFYDWRNRLVATKAGVGGSQDTTVNRPLTYTDYDNLGHVIAQELYDGDGVTIVDGNGDGVPDKPSANLLRARSTAQFDDQGRVYRTTVFSVSPTSGEVSLTGLRTDTWYDQRGQVVKTSAPGGLVSKTTYDGAGRAILSLTTDGGHPTSEGEAWWDALTVTHDTALEQAETDYDGSGNVLATRTRQRFHDATGTGPLGGPVSTDQPKARVYYVGFYYDAAGRLTDAVDVGTNGGTVWTRLETVPTRSNSVLVTSTAYDNAGRVSITTDPRNLETHTTYDLLGRVKTTVENHDTTVSDTTNKTTDFTYFGPGLTYTLTAHLIGSAVQQTKYIYGVAGGSIWSNDLLKEVWHPDLSTGTANSSQRDYFAYNALGETIVAIDRNGTQHDYTYDIVGRRTADAVTDPGDGVDSAVLRLETAHDSAGRAFRFTSYDAASGGNVVNEVQREFNGLGQILKEYQAHGGAVNTGSTPKVQYTYSDMAGGANHSRVTSLVHPDGFTVDYTYASGLNDTISRLSSLKNGSTTLEEYSYLGLGTVVERKHPQPGVDLVYVGTGPSDGGDQYVGLDRFGRVSDQRWKTSSTDLDRYRYGYDADSNRTYRENVVSPTRSEVYTNDGLNQLASFQRGTLNATKDGLTGPASRSQSWDLDALGNFDGPNGVTTDGAAQSRTHNRQNQLTAVGSSALTYDDAGNLTTDDQGRTLVWDAWNRLVKVNGVTRYAYDAAGRRITEGTRALFYTPEWQVIEERLAGVAVARNVWSPVYIDALVLRDRDADANAGNGLEERLYVLADANYNVTGLVSTSGAVVERYLYDPYGQFDIKDAAWGARGSSSYAWAYLHQGGRYDAIAGVYSFRHRDHSPTLMRWTNADPIGFLAGDTNLFRPLGNNPVVHLDPTGLDFVMLLDNTFPGDGHMAALIGNDCDGWAYRSYGPAAAGIQGPGKLTEMSFATLDDAGKHKDLRRYAKYARWKTSKEADQRAIQAAKPFAHSEYSVQKNSVCAEAVVQMAEAAGLKLQRSYQQFVTTIGPLPNAPYVWAPLIQIPEAAVDAVLGPIVVDFGRQFLGMPTESMPRFQWMKWTSPPGTYEQNYKTASASGAWPPPPVPRPLTDAEIRDHGSRIFGFPWW